LLDSSTPRLPPTAPGAIAEMTAHITVGVYRARASLI
jgi:hypothetical protein